MTISLGGVQPTFQPGPPPAVGQSVAAAASGLSLSLSDADAPAASPPPDVVYEPTPTPEDGAALTYASNGGVPVQSADATARSDVPDVAIDTALAASSGLRTQFSVGALALPIDAPVPLPPTSVPGVQATRSAAATVPGLAMADPAPVVPEPQTPSLAQAVYALAADAAVQHRDVQDLIRFA
jgi:hypothetical protein